MGLANNLRDALLTFACPHCAHALTRKGSWFKSVAAFRCAGCGGEVKLTYQIKARVFAQHARLAKRMHDEKAAQ